MGGCGIPFGGGAEAGVEVGLAFGEQAELQRTADGDGLGALEPRLHGGEVRFQAGVAVAAAGDDRDGVFGQGAKGTSYLVFDGNYTLSMLSQSGHLY